MQKNEKQGKKGQDMVGPIAWNCLIINSDKFIGVKFCFCLEGGGGLKFFYEMAFSQCRIKDVGARGLCQCGGP